MMRDTVVVGTSTGGVDALRQLAAGLPARFDAAILVVLHIGANPSMLPQMLMQAGPLPAHHAQDGEAVLPGVIYVAPPDHHLMLDGERAMLRRGPKENFARPAIDPLFRSAAVSRGNRVIGAILTGQLDDGSAGLHAVHECGGITIVQDPDNAYAPDMPRNALRAITPHYVLPLPAIAPELARLAGSAAHAGSEPPASLVMEHKLSIGPSSIDAVQQIALPSALTCPECGGALWEIREAVPPRFRCHTGHTFGLLTLRHACNSALEHMLYDSLRALHEQNELYTRIAAYHMQIGDTDVARQYTEAAGRAAASAKRIEGWLRES
ncbi:chemotaxis protein-glutamate methylesterase [Cupriavidus taiwanensis]|uniref:protein-glutamate methylesterase n=1 Tax=Cupriavidus taiwanensis TaxID=164546 RepID=A0A976G5L2_9BURK|nr:chemotaxis protein CheB [Cupriavidus taiwanensis]SOZ62841.1 chemotaxis protein-glutamate methylesterase [Cupriavidus taiwanensis]SOZ63231.1 chemotaxis protein-glutamate methylesterase [Cupriavidus taiwanensis]SOZ74198.1 chemotaxis protein-glutamate methylesterase [Cupriavidus taiwanensis]SPA01194.1 chemotaxis protein-glutamate methylesterase [Cupriavidus taiwanensis]SPA11100.1 chemotaxis protein-glutamate methylesterase [Cupriavidus taiwanensis]